MLSITFGLLAATFWGAADFLGGMATRRANVYAVVLISEFSGLAMLVPFPFLYGENLPPVNTLLLCGLAGLLGTLGILALYYSMSIRKMSVAGPVSALLAAVIPVVVSSFTEGFPGALKFAGFGMALLAIWLISAGEGEDGSWRFRLGEIALPLLAGIGFGFYLVIINAASQEETFWPLVASRTSSSLLLAVYVLLLNRQLLGEISEVRWQAVLTGFVDIGANLFYVLGGQLGRLDVIAVLGSLYPGPTVLLAWCLLKERISRPQAIGILLALTAIVLITL
jgi:drug/metabolite transporter (DMT)-like permease